MKKIVLIVLILTLVTFVYWTPQMEFKETDVNSDDEAEPTDLDFTEFELEKMEPLSLEANDFFIKNQDEIKKDKLYSKEFYDQYELVCQGSIKKHEDLMITVNTYVQRYVSLFLITSNLLDHKIKDSDEKITIDLEISITKEDLLYLQEYSKTAKPSSYPNNLSKLDAIFSQIARQKKKSYAEMAMASFKFWLSNFNIFSALSSPAFYHFIPFGIIFLIVWIICNFFFHISFYKFIGIIINSLILWESLQLYWKRIKQLDVEIYVKTLQLKNAPKECDPSSLTWYDSVINYFHSNDKCVQYYQNINKNSVEEVFLLQCILDTYSNYLIQTPFRILGSSMKDFTGEISALWPWPIRCIIEIPLILLMILSAFFFALILCGKRLRMSLFGAAVEIGDVKPTNEKIFLNIKAPKTIRPIQKPKPWTKSRFLQRSEVNLVKQRKLYLKTSKSASEMPLEDRPSLSDNEITYA